MVSVIVTVYNIEKYLKACLDSIQASTYKDLEIILVDDGSTDSSGRICDSYSAQNTRLRVIHKANAGVSEARNTGLALARGEYVMFVDGDDLIHPNMIQVLVDAIQAGDYDASMVKGIQLLENDCAKYLSDMELGLISSRRSLTQSDFMRGLFGTSDSEFQYIVVWNKLYKSVLVRDLHFKKTGSEDLEWSLQMGLRIRNIHHVDAWMYYWLQHQGSITHVGFDPVKMDRVNTYLMCLDNIPQEHAVYRTWCLEKLYKVMLHTRYNARDTQYSSQVKALVGATYNKTIKEYLASEMAFTKKAGLLAFYHIPLVYNLFMKLKAHKVKRIVRSSSGMLYVQEGK